MAKPTPKKPTSSANLNRDAIPEELRKLSQWVLWRPETRKGEQTKVPYKAKGRGRAKADDPKTWASFRVASGAAIRFGKNYGLGFVFTAEDPYVGIDLDKCRDSDTKELEPWALKIVEQLSSYTEISPSGRGLHIFVKAKLPKGRRRKGRVEMYEQGRYFTMTGDRLEGTPSTIEERQAELEQLHEETFKKPKKATKKTQERGLELDDQALIEKAKAAKNGADFSELWRGSLNGHKSQSEADLALCSILAFWANGDASRMDRMFRQSGLMRDKWDRNVGGGETYGQRTIGKALESFTEGYTGKKRRTRSRNVVRPSNGADVEAKLYRLTEGGNGERFADKHHEDLRFVPDLNTWFAWDESRWARDNKAYVEMLGRQLIQDLYHEAAEESDEDVRKALASHAIRSDKLNAIRNMIGMARSDKRIATTPREFDLDPWTLNVFNGTLDLRTIDLRSHRREDMLTRLAPTEYDPKARCPRWLSFLDRIFTGNENLIAFVQRALGYSLTGDTSERVLFILHGTGKNGKTKLLEAFRAVLGEPDEGGYSMRTPTETLMTKNQPSIPNDIARLKGARFVSASESEEGKRLAEALIKDLTGGDTITARFLRAEWFDFKPTHKIWLGTNHKPVIRGTDNAIWDRIRLIPFTVRIPDHEQDKKLGEKLKAERAGILAWAIKGLKAWLKHGLGEPEEIIQATRAYRNEMDILSPFFADCCVEKVTARVGVKELHEAYKSWCEANGEKPISKHAFGQRLRERNFETERGAKGKRFWLGLGLLKQNSRG